MIRVRVQIVPEGDELRSREIAEIEVWNVEGDVDEADYGYAADLDRHEGLEKISGHIRSHRRSLGWMPLIARVIHDLQQKIQQKLVRETGR